MKVTINKNGEITADVDSDSDIAMLRKLASFGISGEKEAPMHITKEPPVYFQTPADKNDLMLRLDLSKLPLRFKLGHVYGQLYKRNVHNIYKEDPDAYIQLRDIVKTLVDEGKVKHVRRRGKFFLNLSIASKPVTVEQHEPERPVFETLSKRPYKPSKLFKGYKDLIDNVLPQMPESFGMQDIYKKVFGSECVMKCKRDTPEAIQESNNYGNLYATLRRCVRSGLLSVRHVFIPTAYGTKVKHNVYTKITKPVAEPVKLSEEQKLYTPEASVPEAGEEITYADIPVIDTKVMRSILDTYDSIDANAFKGFRTKNGTPADSTSAQYAFQWIEEHLSAINRLTGRNFAIRGVGGYRYLEASK
jgi:hypothetical protein